MPFASGGGGRVRHNGPDRADPDSLRRARWPRFRSTFSPPAALRARCFALLAAVRAAWPAMFAWLGVALVIDGVDGTFARRLRVAEVLPRWSGDVLDLVVDILTYVFVPAYAIAASGLLPARRCDRARPCHRRDRFALFRRPADEDIRLLFPRLPGAVERRGVLFVPAQARRRGLALHRSRCWRR